MECHEMSCSGLAAAFPVSRFVPSAFPAAGSSPDPAGPCPGAPPLPHPTLFPGERAFFAARPLALPAGRRAAGAPCHDMSCFVMVPPCGGLSSIAFRSPPFPLPAAAPNAASIADGVVAAAGSSRRRTLFRAYRLRARARGRAGVSRRRGSRARLRARGKGRTPPACSLGAVFAPSQPEAASGQPPPPARHNGRLRGFQPSFRNCFKNSRTPRKLQLRLSGRR